MVKKMVIALSRTSFTYFEGLVFVVGLEDTFAATLGNASLPLWMFLETKWIGIYQKVTKFIYPNCTNSGHLFST